MRYMGSKARIAKDILPLILKDRKDGQWYVEPFVGGGNLICKVDGNRIGGDNNLYIIELLSAVRDGWEPPDKVSELLYHIIKDSSHCFSPSFVGFVGFGCSYSGKWWGGWAGRDGRNYALESKKNLLKQRDGLKGVKFIWSEYDKLEIPPNSIIYCDPPYSGTTLYKGYKEKFDHIKFWNWCEKKHKQGHQIFVSEYNAPNNWKCIYTKQIHSSLTKDTGSKQGIEKLFTLT